MSFEDDYTPEMLEEISKLEEDAMRKIVSVYLKYNY